MSTEKTGGILQYWQPLVGIATFLVAGGIFYGKVVSMQQQLGEIEDRQDRQFQLIQALEKRNEELEKKAAYAEGYHDGASSDKQKENISK